MIEAGDRVRLRPLQRSDYGRWLEWINDPAIMEGLDRALPASAEQHERYIAANVTENRTAVWFAIETLEERQHVGIVWLWDINDRHRRAEVRIVIGTGAAGRGYGRDAVNVIALYAFRTLGLHKLYAYVHERNVASRTAFERAGFTVEATLQDEAYWNGAFAAVWRMARFSS